MNDEQYISLWTFGYILFCSCCTFNNPRNFSMNSSVSKHCQNRKRFITRTSFSSRLRRRPLPSDRLPSRKRVSRRASPNCRRTWISPGWGRRRKWIARINFCFLYVWFVDLIELFYISDCFDILFNERCELEKVEVKFHGKNLKYDNFFSRSILI